MTMTATPPRTTRQAKLEQRAEALRARRAAMLTEKAAVEKATADFVADAHPHMTWPAIAEALGIHRARVAQLVSKAKARKP